MIVAASTPNARVDLRSQPAASSAAGAAADVPPGVYIVTGSPNPGSEHEHAPAQTIELTGGTSAVVELQAR